MPILGFLIGVLTITGAKGAVDVTLGAEIRLDDDTEVFIGVSSRYYDQDPKQMHRWNKQCGGSDQRLVMTDTDCRNLVAARMLHECYGISVARAMEMRASGKDLKKLTAGEYRNRHGKKHKTEQKIADNSQDSKGNGKGKK